MYLKNSMTESENVRTNQSREFSRDIQCSERQTQKKKKKEKFPQP